MEIAETKKSPKITKIFNCELCDYTCFKNSEWLRHSATVKHKTNQNGTLWKSPEIDESGKIANHVCKCTRNYVTLSGLWKHKKKCTFIDAPEHKTEEKTDHNQEHKTENINVQSIDANLILQLLKQNQDLQTQMIEMCKNGTIGSNNNNNINNINSNNKTFNMNVFLNEHCKDAMNISEFVDSIQLGYADLVNVGKLGYVEGISGIIIKRLKELDIHKRPMHCGDEKRHSMYIKEDGKWEKDESDNKRLKKLIRQVAFKNTKNTFLFREKYPDCVTSASRYSDQYNKIVIESFGGKGNNDAEKEDKMVRMIAKAVYIDKSL
jgi:hypothetical protein